MMLCHCTNKNSVRANTEGFAGAGHELHGFFSVKEMTEHQMRPTG